MLQKVLIANRGEIAVRVIRACRELGIASVAVFSDADRLSPHVMAADEAYHIGPAPSAQSYLRTDALLDVARRSGCDAVHPGYGFLAERATFAAAVEEAGLVFVGPTSAAIAAMGDKTEARRRMVAADVPVVPGTTEPLQDAAAAAAAALDFGYPVLLKAAAGGGGKGMRVVREEGHIARALEAAVHEAEKAFGDGTVYLEKYLDHPRHVEIQILADDAGRVLYLGERECSIQRRHQKMVEEAPSPAVGPELRRRMGEAAVAAAAAVGYRNAGTIEFLLQDGAFYFLEMNTRIQVEHPVTELVTGLDLVQWQLRIAGGEHLALAQEDVVIQGHALECRITSEDAANGFLPSTGRIHGVRLPGGPGVRWDGAVADGVEISLYYDPLLGKLITYGPDRASAVARMTRALHELSIRGVETSIPFHRRLMADTDFRAGELDIRFLDRHPDLLDGGVAEATLEAAAVVSALLEEDRRGRRAVARIEGSVSSNWRDRGWG